MNVIELSKKSPALKAFQWVAMARCKDPLREIITMLHVELTETTGVFLVVGTDGRRIHIAKCDGDCIAGNYRIIWQNQSNMFLAEDTKGLMYPNWKPLFSKDDAFSRVEGTVKFTNSDTDGTYLFRLALICHAIRKARFDLYYIRDAFSGIQPAFVSQRDELSPMTIANHETMWTRKAQVMPLR
jgi:hypothetical protein